MRKKGRKGKMRKGNEWDQFKTSIYSPFLSKPEGREGKEAGRMGVEGRKEGMEGDKRT